MALPPLANLDLFEDAIAPATIGDGVLAMSLLTSASTLVRAETRRPWVDAAGALETFATHNAAIWETLQTVTVACAKRVWLNPASVERDVTGPFTADYGPDAPDGLRLTDPEKAMLATAVAWADPTVLTSGIWTLGTTRGGTETGTIYAPVLPSGEPFPMINIEQPW